MTTLSTDVLVIGGGATGAGVAWDAALRGFDVVLPSPVLRIGDVADAEQPLDLLPSFIGDGDGLMLLVHDVVAGEDLFIDALLNLLAFDEPGDDAVHAIVLVG